MSESGVPAPALVAKYWSRYGKAMLYVNTADGQHVGWVDLVSGERSIEMESRSTDFDALVAAWFATNPRKAPRAGVDTPGADPSAPAPPQRVPVDLSTRSAGDLVSKRAEEERKKAPVRSALGRLIGANTQDRSWRVGAAGERKVGRMLAKLPDEWRVLHSIPIGTAGSDIDHVAIGPGGVFTINSKHHPAGKVWIADNVLMVNGRKTNYLRNAKHEADRASALLTEACSFPVNVMPVLAIVNATITERAPAVGVHVVYRRRLTSWLTRRPPVLSATAVSLVFEQARWDTTWAGRDG